MADTDFKDSGVPEMTRTEHRYKNHAAKAVVIEVFDALTDSYLPVTAVDDGSGTVSIPVTSTPARPTDAYALSDIDDSTSTEYYGYEDADGAWYIKKFASNAFTFVKGASGYSTAWTNRASQAYASYATTF